MLLERHSTPLVNVALAVDAGYAADSRREGRRRLAGARPARRRHDDARHVPRSPTSSTPSARASRPAARSISRSCGCSALAAQPARRRSTSSPTSCCNPSFPQDMVELAKKRRLAQIGQEKAQPGGRRRCASCRRCSTAPATPTATRSPAPATSARSSRSRATTSSTWHRDWFHPDNATLIVTGDMTMAALLPELERAFGAWTPGQAPAKRIAARAARPPARRVYLIDKPGAPQSVIVAAHVSETGRAGRGSRDRDGDAQLRRHRDVAAQSQPAARQALELRHAGRAAATRAASGRSSSSRRCRPTRRRSRSSRCRRSSTTSPARGRFAARSSRASCARRRSGCPAAGRRWQALEAAAIQLVNYGYPDDYFSTYARRVRALGEPDLAAAAHRRSSGRRRSIWVIVGDLAQIEKGVRELNLGEVTRLDGDGTTTMTADHEPQRRRDAEPMIKYLWSSMWP